MNRKIVWLLPLVIVALAMGWGISGFHVARAGFGPLISVDSMVHASAASPNHSSSIGRIAFAAYRDGNWNIYSIRSDGTDLRRITKGPGDSMSPAWSPDGTRIAFQAKRDANWDIYVIGINDAEPRRLTDDPAYDGAPSWSPDGQRLAFDSYRQGDLDVFVMNVDGSNQTNLTPDSQAADFDPCWSPDGKYLAFTSWQMGDNDIFIMDLASRDVVQWTNADNPEGNATFTPDGRHLAFVQDQIGRREIYVAETDMPPMKGGRTYRLTWYSHDDSPAWSPSADALAFISHRHTSKDTEALLIQDFTGPFTVTNDLPLPRIILEGWEISGPLSWTEHDVPLGEPVGAEEIASRENDPPQPLTSSNSGAFTSLEDISAPNARLAPELVASFRILRAEIHRQTGIDFLAELSDMWRAIDASTETSAYASWHKAGRAFDTLFDHRDSAGINALEAVREDIGGEVYWRVFLKAARQDGTMGLPLKLMPWNFSAYARRRYMESGGTWKLIPYGYYVDVTQIVRHLGWERISAIDREDFNWRWNFLAVEYWHYQRRDGLNWYQAMEQVYSREEVADRFDWHRLIRQQEKPYSLLTQGVPVPPDAYEWLDVQP